MIAATRLQQALTKILVKPRRLGKRVIFDATPSELSSHYLMNSLGDSRVLVDVSKALKKTDVLYEVGDGQVLTAVKKTGLFEPQFFIGSGNNVNDFLISLGRCGWRCEFPSRSFTPFFAGFTSWA